MFLNDDGPHPTKPIALWVQRNPRFSGYVQPVHFVHPNRPESGREFGVVSSEAGAGDFGHPAKGSAGAGGRGE